MDQLKQEFYERVRRSYLLMAESDPNRWLVVDAGRSIETIQTAIRDAVAAKIDTR
jgi:dTMP kinase